MRLLSHKIHRVCVYLLSHSVHITLWLNKYSKEARHLTSAKLKIIKYVTPQLRIEILVQMHLHVANSPKERFLQTVKHIENKRSIRRLANVVEKI